MLYNLSCSVKPGIIPALTQLPNNSKKKKKKNENNYSEGLAKWMGTKDPEWDYWNKILTLQFLIYMTLNKLPNIRKPQFSYFKKEEIGFRKYNSL